MARSRKAFETELDNIFTQLKSKIMYFHNKDEVYGESMMQWFKEVSIKNQIIHIFKSNKQKKDKEMVRRRRSKVYYVDLGVNVGSEFNYPHFSVVVAEHTYTAVVVPISSKKEKDSGGWKEDPRSSYVEIGKIPGLAGPDEEGMDCYALVGQIKTVSKQRLSDFLDKSSRKYITLELTNDQMDIIDQEIIKSLTNVSTEVAEKVTES